jgi:hypothetical protein
MPFFGGNDLLGFGMHCCQLLLGRNKGGSWHPGADIGKRRAHSSCAFAPKSSDDNVCGLISNAASTFALTPRNRHG